MTDNNMNERSLENWNGIALVFGVDWGDSGKGRLIDDLSGRAKIVARYNGGSNTGHTVENENGKFAFHIMPSGIFNPEAICLIGRNVAVDLESLVVEMDGLDKAGVSYKNLVIDEQASLTMPWHKMRDGIRENLRAKKVGTTGRGVGPTYADRTERVGLLVKDLIDVDFKQKLGDEIKIQNEFFNLGLDADQIYKQYVELTERIKQYIGQTVPILMEAKNNGANILFEGAQGYFLDMDAGTYPFVTSSNTGLTGVLRCFDLHPRDIDHVIGITKAYTTRVGEGPMPSEMEEKIANIVIEKGREVGATTGRIRRPGWLDLVLIKAAAKTNGLTCLAVTKLDIFSGLKMLKLCIGYQINGKPEGYRSHDSQFLSECAPVYEELSGWQEDITAARSFDDLPVNAQGFIKRIEDIVGVPVKFISVGPKKGEVIYV